MSLFSRTSLPTLRAGNTPTGRPNRHVGLKGAGGGRVQSWGYAAPAVLARPSRDRGLPRHYVTAEDTEDTEETQDAVTTMRTITSRWTAQTDRGATMRPASWGRPKVTFVVGQSAPTRSSLVCSARSTVGFRRSFAETQSNGHGARWRGPRGRRQTATDIPAATECDVVSTGTHARVMGTAYLRQMPTNSPESSTTGRGGLCCCLLFAALPLIWLVASPLLPEKVFWFPFWLGAVIWNGTDGQQGISHVFG